ncbi:MAG: phosphoenolpyruvate--protein phosphotransferase [Gemmataceae bacterium]|nr:phosphoenolpyruvate--protein phosphotransferase [Gemmataceae bacterium]MDW8266239.1 phosphoenolpyruvate--protein phosphotransferase [Gemmataceae bacterium]
MEIKRGIPVSPGVAIGPAMVLDTEGVRIPQRCIDPHDVEREVQRLRAALREAALQASDNQRIISEKLGVQYGRIFGAHATLIEDPVLVREIEALIRDNHYAAEYAVSRVMNRHAKELQSLQNPLFAARATDLFDIEKSILHVLLGQRRQCLQELDTPVIVLAHDLTPYETAHLDRARVHAFATEAGGRASHTAIMASALDIPAVVGLGEFVTDVSGGDTVIVDGNRGVLIINPDEETLQRYEHVRNRFRDFISQLKELRDLPAETRDGHRVQLLGNIEFPQEASHCLEHGADGVGLYRTEFLYLGRQTDPTEDEHLDAYLTVLRTLGPKQPLVIRTLDLGADKFAPGAETPTVEHNPFLGLRSVRLCLRNLALFKTQIRAILRASAFGDVRIMFPMISTVLELRQCKMILAEVKEDLDDEGVSYNRQLPVGTMIEVPSAAVMAEELAREVDFFSIGTNDLIQYTLAADRTNEAVAALYSASDPAVLRLMRSVIEAARKHGIGVNVCGEMSGDPIYTLLLLGMGLRQLSMTPHLIPEIKKIIRSVSVPEARQVAEEALRLETARDVTSYLREQLRRVLPEAMGDAALR